MPARLGHSAGDAMDSLSRFFSGMERAAKKNGNTAEFQLWQPESHPVQLINNKMAHQKLDYIHYNPMKPGLLQKQRNGNTAVQ